MIHIIFFNDNRMLFSTVTNNPIIPRIGEDIVYNKELYHIIEIRYLYDKESYKLQYIQIKTKLN